MTIAIEDPRPRDGSRRAIACLALCWLAGAACAQAPGNVLVVANRASPESVAIAEYYGKRRQIPSVNFCPIRTATAETVERAIYEKEIESPIQACIDAGERASSVG